MKELIPEEVIERRIFILRGQKVMLSPHIAELYAVQTSALIQATKRNIERFPKDFMFVLSREEIMNLSQTVISSKLKHSPNIYAFTEQGVAMLSGVLHSKRAIQVNIAIMRAFVKLRQILSTHKELAHKLEELERRIAKHDVEIKGVFEAIRQLMAPPREPKRRIGFHTD
ncbi:MAG: ORF6N domain-containing protein [Candidatus Omnitrophica bacterium]|nr:ORF6N domain-containing protein [Candidatus Omnitrophota bacterium]